MPVKQLEKVNILPDTTEAGGFTPASESAAIISMIERAASNPAVDVDKMRALLEIRNSERANEAKRLYNASMVAAQREMRPVAADANNPQTKSRYASFFALDKALRPIYTRHGFGLSFGTGEGALPEYLRVTCEVMHEGGHTVVKHWDMPADGKGAKGGDVMTKTHASGAAGTYGQRYLLKAIFNVAIGDDDDQGADGARPLIKQEQADKIRDALEASGKDRQKFLQLFKIERVEDLKADLFDTAMQRIQGRA